MLSFDHQIFDINFDGKIYWTEQGRNYKDEEGIPIIVALKHFINVKEQAGVGNKPPITIRDETVTADDNPISTLSIRTITYTMDHNNSIRFVYNDASQISKINKFLTRAQYLGIISVALKKVPIATIEIRLFKEYNNYINSVLGDVMNNYLDYCTETKTNPGMIVIQTGISTICDPIPHGTEEFYIDNSEKTKLGSYAF
jgi:hypothetical protein